MSEQKWITITVPVEVMPASSPSGDASGTFESFEGDGDRDARRGLWVRHDGREMRARNVHLVAGMARAWLMEPATDWQERVLNEVLLLPISAERVERERCAAEIVRYGIPAVAFAIDRAWNEGADAERSAAARAAKVEPTTDYAKKLAEIEARERTWRIPARQDGAEVEMLAEDALFVEHAREDVPWLLAQLHAVETALAAAGIPSDGRAPAERIAEYVGRVQAYWNADVALSAEDVAAYLRGEIDVQELQRRGARATINDEIEPMRAALRSAKTTAFVRDVATSYNHDESAHVYANGSCRRCNAEKLLAKLEGRAT
jgi:hypothetical protein